MTWSRTKPAEPGEYWVTGEFSDRPYMVRLRENGEVLHMDHSDAKYVTLWGPRIPRPDPPKEPEPPTDGDYRVPTIIADCSAYTDSLREVYRGRVFPGHRSWNAVTSAGRPLYDWSRARRLVPADEVVAQYLALDEPWSGLAVVARLCEAADHLLWDHDCDNGHEEVKAAKLAGRKLLERWEALAGGGPLPRMVRADEVARRIRSELRSREASAPMLDDRMRALADELEKP